MALPKRDTIIIFDDPEVKDPKLGSLRRKRKRALSKLVQDYYAAIKGVSPSLTKGDSND